jgi:hypothetical protein
MLFTLGADLVDKSIDFRRLKFTLELGHVMFPIGDDVAEIVSRHRTGFRRYQGWPSHEVASGGLAVAFGAVFLIDGGWPSESSRVWSLESVRTDSDACGAAEN